MTNYFEEIVSLINKGETENACRIFYSQFKNQLVKYLASYYKWNKDDAETIVNDSFILLYQQIKDKKIENINFSYLKQLCKFIGANESRKSLREEKKLNSYFEEEKNRSITDYENFYSIELGNENDDFQEKTAIRTFSILDEKCQKLISMKHVENLRHDEIVKNMTEIGNIDSSKSLLNRCMRKWRRLIEGR